jgi:cystathionine beta-lyase/cystathionine gamma-synthase
MASPDSPYAYARWGHPTGRVLEEKVAALEGPALSPADGGGAALALASGMAAVSAVLFTFLEDAA